jgi:hypothetical protein
MVIYETKRTVKPAAVIPFLCILMTASSFTSCQDFFSSSLFPWAARNSSSLIPPVTADNVDELIKMAENNPDLALAVLKGIQKGLKGASFSEAGRLRAAAIRAAVNAVAIGPSLLGNLGEVSASMNQDKAVKFVTDAVGDMKNLSAARDILAAITPDPQKDKKAFDAFISAAEAEELAIASLTFIAAEAKDKGDNMNDYVASFDSSRTLSVPEKLAVRFAAEAVLKTDEKKYNGSLRSLLEGLNLI